MRNSLALVVLVATVCVATSVVKPPSAETSGVSTKLDPIPEKSEPGTLPPPTPVDKATGGVSGLRKRSPQFYGRPNAYLANPYGGRPGYGFGGPARPFYRPAPARPYRPGYRYRY